MKTDLLNIELINSLPHPLVANLIGNSRFPVHDIDVETGLMRIDVCGMLEVRRFSEVVTLEDAYGVTHYSEIFYLD